MYTCRDMLTREFGLTETRVLFFHLFDVHVPSVSGLSEKDRGVKMRDLSYNLGQRVLTAIFI